METTHKRSQGAFGRFASTRRGAITIAALSAALAGIVLMAFVSRYKDRVQGGTVERSALVANRLIPKGTAGAVVVSDGLSKPTTLQQSTLESGALADAAALEGKVATRDIYPGEQITAADFASKADPLRGQLRGNQRAIAVPLDSAHGQIGEIRAGDEVDVLAGFDVVNVGTGRGHPVLRTLIQDVLVLKAPPEGEEPKDANDEEVLTVRLTSEEAARLAFASDNGKVWFIVRPPAGASDDPISWVTLESLLAEMPKIEVGR